MNDLMSIDTKENDQKAGQALDHAKSIVIKTTEDYQAADSYCKGLFKLRKAIEEDFSESLNAADKAKRAATDAKAALVEQIESHTKPVQEAERLIKTKLFSWGQEQDAIRRKEQDRLRAEALKRAEDEQLRKAQELEKLGKTKQAEAVLAKPTKVTAVVLPPAPVKRETKIALYWSYEVVEASEVKREYCSPNAGSIQKAMTSAKDEGKTIEETEALIGGIRIEQKVK